MQIMLIPSLAKSIKTSQIWSSQSIYGLLVYAIANIYIFSLFQVLSLFSSLFIITIIIIIITIPSLFPVYPFKESVHVNLFNQRNKSIIIIYFF